MKVLGGKSRQWRFVAVWGALAYVPRFGDDIFDGMKCNIVRIDEDTYELTIPPEVDLLEAEKVKADPEIGRYPRPLPVAMYK